MNLLTTERRKSPRVMVGYNATFFEENGTFVAKGQASNMSDGGVFVLVSNRNGLAVSSQFVLEMEIPSNQTGHVNNMRYLVRLVRMRSIGHLYGLGLEFIEKLNS